MGCQAWLKSAIGMFMSLSAVVLPTSGKAAQSSAPLPVVVTILPQKHFVERIGGERVTVQVMVSPGASPEMYEPKPRQMRDLAGAVAYFSIGVPFETVWLPKFQALNRSLRVVDTGAGIARLPMAAHHHDHSGEKEDAHGGRSATMLDPHIWLSPPMVYQQARNIWFALTALDPSHASFYTANYQAFIGEIAALDARIRELLDSPDLPRTFMVFHPAWGCFAAAYGLEQWPVELEGKEPKAADLKAFIDQARAQRIRTLFVQPQFTSRSAETIAAAIGARVVALDPLAENWLDNLLQAARELRTGLAATP